MRVPSTGDVLQIPSRDIAELVALEWAGQSERDLSKIKKYTLYMTQLCYMKHDTTNTKTKEEIIENLLKYLSTDSIMFRSPFTTDESLDGSPGIKLKNMQDEQWGPVQVNLSKNENYFYHELRPGLRSVSRPSSKWRRDLVCLMSRARRLNQSDDI